VTRKRVLLIGLPMILAGVLFLLVAGLFSVSRRDVMRTIASREHRTVVTIVFDEVRLSASHGIRVRYKVQGHGELNWAQWRLVPFREVLFEK
jgi:hypothetical protein